MVGLYIQRSATKLKLCIAQGSFFRCEYPSFKYVPFLLILGGQLCLPYDTSNVEWCLPLIPVCQVSTDKPACDYQAVTEWPHRRWRDLSWLTQHPTISEVAWLNFFFVDISCLCKKRKSQLFWDRQMNHLSLTNRQFSSCCHEYYHRLRVIRLQMKPKRHRAIIITIFSPGLWDECCN